MSYKLDANTSKQKSSTRKRWYTDDRIYVNINHFIIFEACWKNKTMWSSIKRTKSDRIKSYISHLISGALWNEPTVIFGDPGFSRPPQTEWGYCEEAVSLSPVIRWSYKEHPQTNNNKTKPHQRNKQTIIQNHYLIEIYLSILRILCLLEHSNEISSVIPVATYSIIEMKINS